MVDAIDMPNRAIGIKTNIRIIYTIAHQRYLSVRIPPNSAIPSGTRRINGNTAQIAVPKTLKKTWTSAICIEFLNPDPIFANAAISPVIVVPIWHPAVTENARSRLITPMPTSGVKMAKMIELDCTATVSNSPPIKYMKPVSQPNGWGRSLSIFFWINWVIDPSRTDFKHFTMPANFKLDQNYTLRNNLRDTFTFLQWCIGQLATFVNETMTNLYRHLIHAKVSLGLLRTLYQKYGCHRWKN